MITNDCSCGARNVARATVCGNCGADITFIGKVKGYAKTIAILAVLVVLYSIFGGSGN